MRIQKYLSQKNILSRRQAEKYLLQGLIKVNGRVITELGYQIDADNDLVEIDERIKEEKQKYIYLAFNKPKGVFTNCPENNKKQITDLLPPEYKHLNSIGRLDLESEGLILLTDDGIFAKKILNAKNPHERKYRVWINQDLTDAQKSALEQGISILGTTTEPVQIDQINPKSFIITMKQGKNRQIRRMLFSIGAKVIGLKRITFGKIQLGSLKTGEFRMLTDQEIASF